MTLRFKDQVTVRSGFFKGKFGKVTDVRWFGLQYQVHRDRGGDYFESWIWFWQLKKESGARVEARPEREAWDRDSDIVGAVQPLLGELTSAPVEANTRVTTYTVPLPR
jgi:hypothetical protein